METKHTYSTKDFCNQQELTAGIEVSDDQKTGNMELVEQELESLKVILNDQECNVLAIGDYLAINDKDHADQLQTIIKLSLVPTCTSKKFVIVDAVKDIKVELRCLPSLELVVIVPTYYPSSGRPLLFMETPFYEPFKEHLYEKLNESWTEDMPVLYNYVIFVQDEFLNSFFETADTSKFTFNSQGNLEFKYQSSMEF